MLNITKAAIMQMFSQANKSSRRILALNPNVKIITTKHISCVTTNVTTTTFPTHVRFLRTAYGNTIKNTTAEINSSHTITPIEVNVVFTINAGNPNKPPQL